MMQGIWKRGLLIVAVALAVVVVAGCGSGAAADDGGCDQSVRGVAGVIHPETSKLSCSEIRSIIQFIPTTPGAFIVESKAPRLSWDCVLYGRSSQTLIRCHRPRRAFSVIRAA